MVKGATMYETKDTNLEERYETMAKEVTDYIIRGAYSLDAETKVRNLEIAVALIKREIDDTIGDYHNGKLN